VTASPFGATTAGIGASVFKIRATVQMRLVDVETGRIFAAAQKQMQQVVPGSFRYGYIGFSGDCCDAAILTIINSGVQQAIDELMRGIVR
jgi:curli biogenesis system outer membrane secretion channel CsgG